MAAAAAVEYEDAVPPPAEVPEEAAEAVEVEVAEVVADDVPAAEQEGGQEEEPEWFEKLAKANRKKATWYYVKDDATKVVVKHIGEDAIEKAGETDKAACEKLFKDNSFPIYGKLDGNKGIIFY